ncbi:hypothetical protein BDQ17DRAFT_1244951 [Cyathus striatus]|nr:hypothetical protein BDQ17DRAFT_1244951 [Cyathus striatus]
MEIHFDGDNKVQLVGMTLFINEVASENRLSCVPATDDAVGLCYEHISQIGSMKMGSSLDVSYAIVEAVHSGKVHISQEILVAALGHNDDTDYGTKPVLILPMCKCGSFEDATLLVEKIQQAWKMVPCGEAHHGEIWSISSDSDPKHCTALYLHCMVCELSPSDSLFQHLGSLPGFNLWMGSNFKIQYFDWKHLLKHSKISIL